LSALSSTSSIDFGASGLAHEYVARFFAELSTKAILAVLMHSWSFLYREERPGGFHYIYKDQRLVESFERFLGTLPQDVKVITASDLDQLIRP
jgi:hypothetical protein